MTTENPSPEATTAGPAAAAGRTFTQDEVNELIRERLARVKGGEEAEARFAELEKTVKDTQALLQKEAERATAAEQKALRAAVLAEATDFANPSRALQLISADLEGVSSDDTDKIKGALDALRSSDPYLLKPADGAAAPVVQQPVTPGANAPASVGHLSAEQLSTMKAEDLAKDPEKMKLYIESLEALQK